MTDGAASQAAGPVGPPAPAQGVLAIAHRAGNALPALKEAVRAGVDVIEADVHHHRGRLEVRHLKTLGPVPLLWDRWELAPAWRRRLLLHELLTAADAGIPIMLDLKGRRTGTGLEVAKSLHQHAHGRPVWVCGRHWPAVDGFSALPWVRAVLSARNSVELAALRRRLRSGAAPYGVSVHRTLLTPEITSELHEQVRVVMTWPVNDAAALDQVLAVGATGVISDEPAVLRMLRSRQGRPAQPLR